jgi:hypothetical protein
VIKKNVKAAKKKKGSKKKTSIKAPRGKQDAGRKKSFTEFSLNNSLVRGQDPFNEEMKSIDD